MEQSEIDASTHHIGSISSAAHYEPVQALNNAIDEADERISTSAWWAYDRTMLSRYALKSSPLSEFLNDPQTEIESINIGTIESFAKRGHVAVSILTGRSYPYAVLGSGISQDVHQSAQKAFFESVQSWTASKWLHDNEPQNTPLWDVHELQKRATKIAEAPSDTLKQKIPEGPGILNKLSVRMSPLEGVFVAHIYDIHGPVSGRSLSLAALARIAHEQPSVFTDHNL